MISDPHIKYDLPSNTRSGVGTNVFRRKKQRVAKPLQPRLIDLNLEALQAIARYRSE